MPVVGGIPPLPEEANRRKWLAHAGRMRPEAFVTEGQRPYKPKPLPIPTRKIERWKRWKGLDGVRPPGHDIVWVWRDDKTKRFCKPPAIGERARMLGLKNKERREDVLDDDPR